MDKKTRIYSRQRNYNVKGNYNEQCTMKVQSTLDKGRVQYKRKL